MKRLLLPLLLALALLSTEALAGGGGRPGGRGAVPGPSRGGTSGPTAAARTKKSKTKKDEARLRERAQAELRDAIVHDAANDRM